MVFLKNNKIYKCRAQSVIEYALLVAIAIVALLISANFVSRLKSNAFENHFQAARGSIGGSMDTSVIP